MKKSEKWEKDHRKVKDLEEDNEVEGIAGNILHGIGGIIPGLGGLVKNLEKMDVFRERLKAIDEEVGRRFKGVPSGGRTPRVQTGFTSRPRTRGRPAFKEEVEIPQARKPKEYRVDLFDEGDHLRVVAELPGAEEKDIKVTLKGKKLIISADMGDEKYRREVNLPSSPKGEFEKAYRNGILEIKIQKTEPAC